MPDGKQDPALAGFAAQVQALREARAPTRVGVLVPTYNRPDLLRFAVMQLAAQSRAPDIICVHQNGVSDSYKWAVDDLRIPSQLAWLHTPAQLPQHQWYSIPLKYLIDNGCSHFFWVDHDDIYLRDHIEKGLADLEAFDFSVSSRCGLLFTKATDFRYNPQVNFTSNAPGGMASTMCFTRRFAQALLADIEADASHYATVNVVAQVTMPKFRCKVSDRMTSVYHAHEGAVEASKWLPPEWGGT
ncbi:MAG TPA: glycosyltransferase family A protein [Ramlibacter sp.]